MKKFLSILIAVASILLGIYLGVWVMFIGGIVQVVNSINPVNALGIAIGIYKDQERKRSENCNLLKQTVK